MQPSQPSDDYIPTRSVQDDLTTDDDVIDPITVELTDDPVEVLGVQNVDAFKEELDKEALSGDGDSDSYEKDDELNYIEDIDEDPQEQVSRQA